MSNFLSLELPTLKAKVALAISPTLARSSLFFYFGVDAGAPG